MASHHLISDAATPPCGDARRGIGSPKPGVEFEKLAHPEFLDFRRSQGKHIVMSDGSRILTIPRHNPVNEYTMGGIVRDAGLTIEKFKKLL